MRQKQRSRTSLGHHFHGKSTKILNGYTPLLTSYLIIKNRLNIVNPRSIYILKEKHQNCIPSNLIGRLITFDTCSMKKQPIIFFYFCFTLLFNPVMRPRKYAVSVKTYSIGSKMLRGSCVDL